MEGEEEILSLQVLSKLHLLLLQISTLGEKIHHFSGLGVDVTVWIQPCNTSSNNLLFIRDMKLLFANAFFIVIFIGSTEPQVSPLQLLFSFPAWHYVYLLMLMWNWFLKCLDTKAKGDRWNWNKNKNKKNITLMTHSVFHQFDLFFYSEKTSFKNSS